MRARMTLSKRTRARVLTPPRPKAQARARAYGQRMTQIRENIPELLGWRSLTSLKRTFHLLN